MKKVVATLVIALFATSAFAQFAPVPMVIDAPTSVEYSFDGSTLGIDVTLTGAPGNAVFAVYTKDMAASMPNIRNGFLGWHEVNKIDTCIYFDAGFPLNEGANTVEWDGMNQDGNQVEEGEYTYYIFAYDNLNAKILATNETLSPGWGENVIITYDAEGNNLDAPYFISNRQGAPEGYAGYAQRSKWVIGNEPTDDSFIETTLYPLPEGYAERAKVQMSKQEANMFYVAQYEPLGTGQVVKYMWVSNGEAELQTEWGDGGEYNFLVVAQDGWDANVQDMALVGDNTLVVSNTSHYGATDIAALILVDATDGVELSTIEVTDWWIRPDDEEAEGQKSSGPNTFAVEGTNLYMGAHSTCLNQMIAPLEGEDGEEVNRWVNDNGDIIGDHNWAEDSAKPWVCHDFNTGPYKYHMGVDANGFSTFPTYDIGAVSFGLFGPDGTGIDYFAFAAEDADLKRDTQFIQTGSAFDGIYTDNTQLSGDESRGGYWYVPHDSVKGTISSEQVAVEDDAPAAFAVAQNTPNPFNPTTTISFSIAEAGQVDIDVFNVAGQKIDTIASNHLSAGNHTVTWDASGFSAGVYFYTVKAEGFSKTMKMTLLK